ncbi:unnamed protein product [Boreogadus saida]
MTSAMPKGGTNRWTRATWDHVQPWRDRERLAQDVSIGSLEPNQKRPERRNKLAFPNGAKTVESCWWLAHDRSSRPARGKGRTPTQGQTGAGEPGWWVPPGKGRECHGGFGRLFEQLASPSVQQVWWGFSLAAPEAGVWFTFDGRCFGGADEIAW